jgi:hypothetical protein
MNPVVRNSLAVLAGLVVGSIVNMGLILASAHLIPPPAGADNTTMEGLRATMHLFEPKHFLFPFLAHALGTMAGAGAAAAIGASHQFKLAMGIGALFLAGGIVNCFLLPAPAWFMALDVLLAYLPMAWIGWKIGSRK